MRELYIYVYVCARRGHITSLPSHATYSPSLPPSSSDLPFLSHGLLSLSPSPPKNLLLLQEILKTHTDFVILYHPRLLDRVGEIRWRCILHLEV